FETYRSLKRYDKKKASFRTWLYKIANYRCIDYLRSRAYKYQADSFDEAIKTIADNSNDVLTTLIQQEKTQTVNELMRRCLKPKHERIMRYYFYAD
ncbi:RNA polymerase sigma factor, partial [Acinetobacter baumannii]